jgi:hypothetical protein
MWLPIWPIKRTEMNELALANKAADWRTLKALVLDSVSSPGAGGVLRCGLSAGYARRPDMRFHCTIDFGSRRTASLVARLRAAGRWLCGRIQWDHASRFGSRAALCWRCRGWRF